MCIAALAVSGLAVGQAPAPRDGKPSLAFMSELAGKIPNEVKLLEHPAMKARLASLLKNDASLVAERFQTVSPIHKQGDVVAFSGNKSARGR